MQRTLEPELLDSLPPDHPDALHNRRDLRWVNRLMGNHRWLAHTLPPLLQPGETALELGAGTGELGRRLARAGAPVDGLDLWPRPVDWPSAQKWHVANLLTFPGYDAYSAIVGNLIFHQFSEADLAELGSQLGRRARIILAREPARRSVSQKVYRVLAAVIGANHVSRHDGHVSIAAGFIGDELPEMLGLDPAEWSWDCVITSRCAYQMVAIRRT